MTNPLSPAAQAVWRAHKQVLGDECVLTKTDMKALVAALHAAADQVVPADKPCSLDELKVQCRIRAIAIRLEQLDD